MTLMTRQLSFPKEKIRIYLAEKVHEAARQTFESAGYRVEQVGGALSGGELQSALVDAHILGVRSRTQIRGAELAVARRLLAVGCYTVGTDQVDLPAAQQHAVPVFNAPRGSTRSVAELAIADMLALARKIPWRSARLHQGFWEKSAAGAVEVRGKTLGIVGYGQIGQQTALLAEAIGMRVLYHDIEAKQPRGRAQPAGSLDELLSRADFASLHVPGGQSTVNLIRRRELSLMHAGSFLLNLSRGSVVDLEALRDALRDGRLAGAALDVFPDEPPGNLDRYSSILSGMENVILTPHIGGSTEEAQANIGREVSEALIAYLDRGDTQGAVNFPSVHLPPQADSHRLLWIHRNVPGALRDVNRVIADLGININAQHLGTLEDVGYLIMDVNRELSDELKRQVSQLPQALKTRILY